MRNWIFYAISVNKDVTVYQRLQSSKVSQWALRALRKEKNTYNLAAIPGLGRSPGEANSYLLQYSCLENSMDRGAWWAIVHGVKKRWTQLRDCHFHLCFLHWQAGSLPGATWEALHFHSSDNCQVIIRRACLFLEDYPRIFFFLTSASLNVNLF